MRRADSSSCDTLIAAERALLKCLCRDRQLARVSLVRLNWLRDYGWVDPEHRIVFDALERSTKATGFSPREYLPAEATRMGFPDIHWDAYLENDANGLMPREAEPAQTADELIDTLIRQSAKRA